MASDLPVDVLVDIFLRLDDVADLARASAACAAFRRVVSDGRFLRRFRSLHRRPVLGLLLADKKRHFVPAQPPRRSAQAAAAFAKAADFSFLPESKRWRVCDARDSRVLLTRARRRRHRRHRTLSVDLVVYDPLHRRHVHLPTIPGDLLQSANNEAMSFDDPFLAPAAADDDQMGFQFQVMFTALIALPKTKVVAFVFSSVSGQWQRVVSFCTGLPISNYLVGSNDLPCVWLRQYVHSWVCWVHYLEDVMLVFDTREMKLSITHLPRKSAARSKMVVEAGDGRLGLLLLSYDGCTEMDLYSKPLQGGIKEWRHDSPVPLIPGFQLMFAGAAAEGYVLLLGFRLEQRFEDKPQVHYFTLEVKTFLAEKLCVLEYHQPRNSFLYASFPPLFSSPSIV